MDRMRSFMGCGVLVVMLAATWASAHGPQLKVDRTSVAAGATVTVTGEGIASNGAIHVTLQGVLRDYDLGTTQGDEHGRFQMEVTLPAELAPGEYTLIASGKETATVRLTVTAATEAAQPAAAAATQGAPGDPAEHAADAGGAEARDAHVGAGGHEVQARDEPMNLARTRSAGELAVVWATILMSAAIGVTLLVRRG